MCFHDAYGLDANFMMLMAIHDAYGLQQIS